MAEAQKMKYPTYFSNFFPLRSIQEILKCEELLVLAEKRTLKEWSLPPELQRRDYEPFANGGCVRIDKDIYGIRCDDAAYIAACGSGVAEAGWKATIAAIDLCTSLKQISLPTSWNFNVALTFENSIMAAWPEELL